MNIFIFTKLAEKKMQKLPKHIRIRIIEKLSGLKCHDDIFSVLKRLYNFLPATHRLRIGNYRLIVQNISSENDGKFRILDVGHRKDVYL
ncbi:hypothetical protein COB57_03570 [Candidatus Peregrinibacteria bacterium]|nr:MAG: hypothetical protein COB57_03570 [Candidatus Peregrinibacteria bacterium]